MDEELRDLVTEKVSFMLCELDDVEPGSQKHQALTGDIKALLQTLNEANRDELDAFDKQEKRRIDEQKSVSMAEVERLKLKFDWLKGGLELAKIIIPTGMSILAYYWFQSRVFQFEEHGRIVSGPGRQLSLPRFWK